MEKRIIPRLQSFACELRRHNLPSSDLRKLYVVSCRVSNGFSLGVSPFVLDFGAGDFGMANSFDSNSLCVNEVNIGIGIFNLTSSFTFGLLMGWMRRDSVWKISLICVSSNS